MRTRYLVVLALAFLAGSVDHGAFIPIFDGCTLNGWSSSDMRFWSVEEHAIDFLFHRDRPAESEPQASFSGHLIRLLDHQGYPACKPPWGTLVCLNLNTGKIVWKAVLGEYEELTAQGIPKTGTPNLGGTLVTAGTG